MSRGAEGLGTPRLHLAITGSTNDVARRLAGEGAPHGTLITAAEQTAGRGRHGRRWSAPRGCALLMSLLLREWPPILPLAVPLAVCDVIGDDALVKWPNDVVMRGATVEGARHARRGGASVAAAVRSSAANAVNEEGAPLRKLAGILIEGRPQEGWLVVGIGLNVAVDLDHMPEELRSTAATMGKGEQDVEPVLDRLLPALDDRLAQPTERIVADWRARDALLGVEVSFAGGKGVAEGIDDGGKLLVRGKDGSVRALDSGEVALGAATS